MASIAHPAQLDTLAWEAAFKLKRSKQYETSAVILLLDCKRRIDAGEAEAGGLTWAQFCRVHFPNYPPNYLEQLIGRHHDDSENENHIAMSKDAFDRAWTDFVTLAPERQREFLRCGVAYAMESEGEESSAPCELSVPQPHALDCEV